MSKKTHQHQLAQRKAARQAQRQAERERRRRTLVVTITAIVSVLIVVVGAFLIAANTGGDPTPAAGSPSAGPSTPTPVPSTAGPQDKPKSIPTALAPALKRPTALPAQVDCTYKASAEPAGKKVNAPANGKTKADGTSPVTLATSVGDLHLTLDSGLAPCAVKSFLSLVGQKYFDGTSCHRLTVGEGLQVLQCGDPSGTGSGGPGYSFADEVYPTLKYGRGVLAMANAGPDTNGSQFFIVYGDASALNPAYTAFGRVDQPSLQLIDKVARAGVVPGSSPGDGKPAVPVTIRTATAGA